MGFRSTFITEDNCLIVPNWFRKKYGKSINYYYDKTNKTYNFPISSYLEGKTYSKWDELPNDIQKIIKDKENKEIIGDYPVILVYLHECGGITRLEIYKDKIYYSEPEKWKNVNEITHDYCYGCSDVRIKEER